MFTQTRFLTTGLATLAIASAVTLASPASAADLPDRPCGQPAVPAVYVTVVVDAPEVRVVPAVTHDEWRWQRDVTTLEQEFSKVVAAAYDETDWTRDLPAEYRWTRTVVTQEAVPAVPGTPEVSHVETVVVTPAVTVTLFEYVQKEHPEMTRWEEDGWNGEHSDGDHGRGWTKTGRTRDEVVTPAVTKQVKVVDEPATAGTPEIPAVSHVEETWSTTSPGADWSRDLSTPPHGGGTETVTTTGDVQPVGAGWAVAAVRHIAAVVDTQWALEAPDGYTPTGASRVRDVTTEQTDTTAATPPAGDGWTKIADSLVVVVDQPETTELVGNGSTREVMISPELPATPACPAAAPGDTTAPVETTSGPKAGGVTSAVAGAHAATQVAAGTSVEAAAAESSTVLPATGNPVSPLLLTTGLGALLAGGVLVRAGRKRTTR